MTLRKKKLQNSFTNHSKLETAFHISDTSNMEGMGKDSLEVIHNMSPETEDRDMSTCIDVFLINVLALRLPHPRICILSLVFFFFEFFNETSSL